MRKTDIKVGDQVGWRPYKGSVPTVVTVLEVGTFESRRYNSSPARTAVTIGFTRPDGGEWIREAVPIRELCTMAEVEQAKVRNERARAERIAREDANKRMALRLQVVVEELHELGFEAEILRGTGITLRVDEAERLVKTLEWEPEVV